MTEASTARGGLARDAAVLAAGTVVGKILLQGFHVIAARGLSVEGFGIVALAITLTAILVDLTTPLNSNVLIRFGRSGELAGLIRTALRTGFVAAGAVAVLVLAFAGPLSTAFFEGHTNVLRLIVFAVPAVLLHRILGTGFVIDGRARSRAVLIDVLHPLLLVIGIASLLGLDRLTPTSAVAVYTTSTILVAINAHLRSGWRARPVAVTKRLRRYAVTVYSLSNLSNMVRHVDLLLLAVLLNPVAVGLYAAANQFTLAMEIWTRSLVVSFGPRAARHLDEQNSAAVVSLYRSASRLGVAAVAPLVVGGIVAAPDLLAFVFGPDYAAAAAALSVLLVGAVVRTATIGASTLLTVGDRERAELGITAIGTLVTTAVTVALVPVLGLVGAAIAKVLGLSLLQVFRFRLIRAILGQRLGVRHITGPLAVMLAATLAGGMVRALLGPGFWPVAGAVIIAETLLVIGFLGTLDRRERQRVLGLLLRRQAVEAK